MEKKTMDALHMMICGELEDIAKMDALNHETLDILKDLLESEKNLMKIEKYKMEKEEMERSVDQGYSQRKYYIDADYQPYGQSYARGDQGNSYARGGQGNSYERGMGNSYNYYDPMYGNQMYSMARGYSMTGKEEMVEELKKMMMESNDDKVRSAISEAINKMSK